MPHRPACRRRRIARSGAAGDPRARSGGVDRSPRAGRRHPVHRPARRRALARLDLRRLRLLPGRPREPLRRAGVHRLHAPGRLRQPPGRARRFLHRAGRRRPGRRRAPAVCGADRLARPRPRRRRERVGYLRFRRGRPPDDPDRPSPGASGAGVHPAGRPCCAGFRPCARRRLGWRLRCRDARAAGRGGHLRAGRRARDACLARGTQGRACGMRRYPHVGHPGDAVSLAVGGAGTGIGGQPDPGRRACVLCRGPPGQCAGGHAALPAGGRQRGARRPAPGTPAGGGGTGAVAGAFPVCGARSATARVPAQRPTSASTLARALASSSWR